MASSPGGDDTSSVGSWSPEIKSRWRFTTVQNDILEEAYRENPNPSQEILESLVTELHSPRKTIITWFQNRRAKERRHQRQQQQRRRRQWMRDQPPVNNSHVIMTRDEDGMESSREETPPPPSSSSSLLLEDFALMPRQEVDYRTTTMTVQQHQDQPYQEEMVPPLDVLLPPSQILSHEVFWYHPLQNRNHNYGDIDGNMVTYASNISTEEWLSFSALWQYVCNQSQYLSDDGEAHLNP